MTTPLKRIVIVGGGAGGLEMATQLGKKLGRKKKAKITLVDRNHSHLWKPLLHEVATGSLDEGVDALSYLDEIPMCVAYEVDGKIIHDFPTTPELERCKPVWKVLPGWKQNIRGITKYEDLPEACRNYVEFIEQEIGVRITMVSNGPGREEILHR